MSKAVIGEAFDTDKQSLPTVAVEFNAVWDTGASASAISRRVVSQCRLKPTGMTRVSTAGGFVDCCTYLISMGLPNKVGFPVLTVTEADMGSTDVLIGMDIIGAGDFAVSNFHGTTVFTYRFPSARKIDFVADDHPDTDVSVPRVGRNDPCPCGSGKKYKKCCGA
jgi:hypothetical protein